MSNPIMFSAVPPNNRGGTNASKLKIKDDDVEDIEATEILPVQEVQRVPCESDEQGYTDVRSTSTNTNTSVTNISTTSTNDTTSNNVPVVADTLFTRDNYTLTDDQKAALADISTFLSNKPTTSEDYFHTLAGWAGTGKSTLISKVLEQLPKRTRVTVSAPTHKAKEVISNFTGIEGETIQALLGMRLNVDIDEYDPKKTEFAVTAKERMQNYDLIVIDEASMLGKNIVNLIKDTAVRYGVRILFSGKTSLLPE